MWGNPFLAEYFPVAHGLPPNTILKVLPRASLGWDIRYTTLENLIRMRGAEVRSSVIYLRQSVLVVNPLVIFTTDHSSPISLSPYASTCQA